MFYFKAWHFCSSKKFEPYHDEIVCAMKLQQIYKKEADPCFPFWNDTSDKAKMPGFPVIRHVFLYAPQANYCSWFLRWVETIENPDKTW